MKVYLSDGVYVDNDGFNLILTTENGIDTMHTIYLDAVGFEALVQYVRSWADIGDSEAVQIWRSITKAAENASCEDKESTADEGK